MYFVKITDCKGKEIQVEVSLEVFEEFIKFEKFDKMMEKRDNRHLEKRELSDILIEKHCMVKPVSIEDKYIQNELICKMLSKLGQTEKPFNWKKSEPFCEKGAKITAVQTK